MTPAKFIEVFDTIAEAPGGIERLRELVLQLAVRGKLVPQEEGDEPAEVLLDRIADEKSRLIKERKLRIPKPLPPIATRDIPFDVPDQWEWVRLGDIANSRLGKMLDKSKNKGPYRRYLRNANVQWFRFDLSDVLELRLEDAELEECSVKENDLVVCEGGEPGRAAVCGPDVDGMVFQKALHRVRPWCCISTRYLAYLLRCDTWSERINSLFTGATIKHLTGKALATYMVPLPPVSEQYRIVAKIDELMGLIDRLEAIRQSRESVRTAGRDSTLAVLCNATTPEEVGTAWKHIADRMDDLFTTPADLAPLRETVLQLAVQGRLVRQDADEEPATVLLERISADNKLKLEKRLSPINKADAPWQLPDSWTWVRLRQIVNFTMGKTPPTRDVSYWSDESGHPWVSIADMDHFGIVSETKRRVTTKATSEVFGRPPVSSGTILMSFKLTIGKIARLGVDAYHNEAIIALYPTIDEMDAYLFQFMPLFSFGGSSKDAIKGKTLNSNSLSNLLVALPPLAEQHRIVVKVNELMGLIDRLEQHLVVKGETQGDFADTVCSFAQQGVEYV